MATRFTPLNLALVDEGRLLAEADAELRDLQQELLLYRDLHKDKAKGAKAKLTIEVTLVCEHPADGHYSIKAQVRKTTPARPASTTMAMSAEDAETDRPCLFVRNSGSDRTTPRQGKLTTDEGQVIDQQSGKAAGG